jgi:hypothetical protein
MPRSLKPLMSCLCCWVAAASALAADGGRQDAGPPWPAQYKIKPAETERLTEADVVGPDGIVYPNWTRCGVQGGIPQVETKVKIEAFDGRSDDGQDDSTALHRACEAVAADGGGAVLLGEGTYHLDWPVTVRHDGVVIRGRGADKTKLIFRYAIPSGGVAFYGLKSGDHIGRNTQITLHARPAGLATMAIQLDERVVHEWKRSTHSGNTFATSVSARDLVGRLADGPHALRGVARYQDGTTLTTEIPVELDAAFNDTRRVPDWRAAILFAGRGLDGPPLELTRDGRRGGRTLELRSSAGLKSGDCIFLEAPATPAWKQLTKNACPWGRYREYELQIEKIAGDTITASQPLRIDFPVADGAFVRRVLPIQRCGIEDLHLEQTENLWISGVLFSHAWNCWARGVTINKCGRFPVYGSQAKWCEIRDCVFDDAWFKGGGGTAYAGWDNCWDCLMEGVETFKLRHGPLFQWAASGNVIRKSVFHDSDAQWHAGWTHENLIEQCVVESATGHGGYSYGMWASPPEDGAHGPNGPRNVVYNCDIRSPKTGLWMGGMNENWLILYNRFRVEKGPGVLAKTASFDHILRGNAFVLRDPQAAMVNLATQDCTGIEILDNQLYGGNGKFVAGPATPGALEANRALPYGDAPRPQPNVPSIYEWQCRQSRK